MGIKRYGVKDFKAIGGEIAFELSPVSIFIGQNSSGKSSILKSLLLIKESLKYSRDFRRLYFSSGDMMLGTFSSILNNESADGRISFTFPLNIRYVDKSFNLVLTYKQGMGQHEEDGILTGMRIEDEEGNIIYAGHTHINSLKEFKETFLPIYERLKKHPDDRPGKVNIEKMDDLDEHFNSFYYHDPAYFLHHLDQQMEGFQKRLVENDTEEVDISEFITTQDVINMSLKHNNAFESWEYKGQRKVYDYDLKDLDPDQDLLRFFKTYSEEGGGMFSNTRTDYNKELPLNQTKAFSGDPQVAFGANFIMQKENINLFDEFKKFKPYYNEIAGKVENLFTYKDSIAVELSEKGKFVFETMYKDNIVKAVNGLIYSLERMEHLSSYRGITERIFMPGASRSHLSKILDEFGKSRKSTPERDFVNKWLKVFGIGDKLNIRRYEGAASAVFLEKDNRETLLADLGYGFHQLLPIILQIVLNARKLEDRDGIPGEIKQSIILLEEPESNLHPNLQSKLADLVIDAVRRFNIQFIIETHSEYLVRKLQFLTTKGTIKPGDTRIHYFDKMTDGSMPAYEIGIENDGSLTRDFGPGFFDEADNLAIDLFNLKKNKN